MRTQTLDIEQIQGFCPADKDINMVIPSHKVLPLCVLGISWYLA